MKKITLLTMLFSLFSVLTFAQNNLRLFSMENAQSQNPTFKCLNRHAPSALKTYHITPLALRRGVGGEAF